MLVSGREAATMLAEVGLARRQARMVLDAGLAGTPLRTAGATLYDAERVAALVVRPRIDNGVVVRRCPHGLLLDRRTEPAGPDVALPLPFWVSANLRLIVGSRTRLPYVATVGGFVVAGADIIEVGARGDDGMCRLTLAEPGEWFADFHGTRWPTGRGPSWLLVGRRVG